MRVTFDITRKWWLVCLPVWLLLASCDKFEGPQTVPSYLSIDSVGFYCDPGAHGTSRQNIVDVWVYVDDDLIGGFEMPARIPILAEGSRKVEIRPGIILNGISDTRAPYPCIQPIVLNEFTLAPDSVIRYFGATTYLSNAEFIWMENFEDPSLAIVEAKDSDTGIYLTQPAGAAGAFLEDNSAYSGISYLDTERNYLLLTSDDGDGQGFVFDRGDFIFLEIHYRNDLPLVIGAFILKKDNTVQKRPFIILNPADRWKKVYVNFTPMVNETADAVDFKIYFEATKGQNDPDAVMMFDNIKLITRPNL